jgi:hypothetical protein
MDDIKVAPLRAWSLATFHTGSFVAAVVALVHVSGSLRSRLASLDTSKGVLMFLAFWALTWFVTLTALRRMDPPIDEAGSGSIVMSMTVAGGWNGVAIFAALFLTGPLWALHWPVGVAAVAWLLPVLFLIVVIGTALAFTIGGIVGMCYGLVDALLVGCGSALYEWASMGSREPV